MESHRRGPGTWGSQAFVFWTISLEGVWKCGRRMGITESRKTVHLSSICWAPSLCQTLWQGLRIPNGVQWKGEPLRTHSRGGDMNQCFNSILWLVWLQEGKGWLSLTREIYSPSPLSVELCRVIWSPQSSPLFPPSSNTLFLSWFPEPLPALPHLRTRTVTTTLYL